MPAIQLCVGSGLLLIQGHPMVGSITEAPALSCTQLSYVSPILCI